MEKSKTWLQWKEEGCELLNKNQWPEAVNCFTRAICAKNDEADLYLNRATCELKLQKFSLACEDAEAAIRLDSKNLELYRILVEAQKGMLSNISSAAGGVAARTDTTQCPRCSQGSSAGSRTEVGRHNATSTRKPILFDLFYGLEFD